MNILPSMMAGCLLLATAMDLRAAEVSATLSTNRMHVGDRARLVFTITAAPGEFFRIPSIDQPPYIMVWNEHRTEEPLEDQRRRIVHEISFSSFALGEHRVVTNPVVVIDAAGVETPAPLPNLLIDVVSVLSNPPPPLAEIKPPATIPGADLRTLALWLVAIVLAAAAGALLLRWWLRRPRATAPARAIPPHEIALSALQALRGRGYMENNQPEPFYVELSAIVRVYLEQRFDLHAPEQTTEEFIRSSSQSRALSLEHRQLTQEFLAQSDLVKFARFNPAPEDMQQALAAAERLVRETIPTTGGAA